MFCKKIKQLPLAPNLQDLLITHANLARRVTFFSKMAFAKCRQVWQVWQMTIFGEYSIKTLAPLQCTCQAWYICAILAKLAKLAKYHDKYFGKCEFGKYSKKSLASLASLASHKKIPKLSLWRVRVLSENGYFLSSTRIR